MQESKDSKERRQHERAPVQTIVVGMLDTGYSKTVGSIADISFGGVKLTYHESGVTPRDSAIHSIDLMAGSHNLVDIPCRYAWDVVLKSESDHREADLRQCGIQFGRLTPKQSFLLRSFIDHWAFLGTSADDQKTYS